MRTKSTRVAAGIGLVTALGLFAVGLDAHADAPIGSDANQPEAWETHFAVEGIDCFKKDLKDPAEFTVPDEPEDRTWYAVVVKAGDNQDPRTIYRDVEAGDVVQHGTKDSISHVILCSVPEATTTPPVTESETPTTTPPVTESETPTTTPPVTESEKPGATPTKPSASGKPTATQKPTSTAKPTATHRPGTPAGLPNTGN